jgi:hypothetical protein
MDDSIVFFWKGLLFYFEVGQVPKCLTVLSAKCYVLLKINLKGWQHSGFWINDYVLVLSYLEHGWYLDR